MVERTIDPPRPPTSDAQLAADVRAALAALNEAAVAAQRAGLFVEFDERENFNHHDGFPVTWVDVTITKTL